MSQILKANKYELVQGSKINCMQLLYKNNLYNKHKTISWKCISCSITLSVNEIDQIVTREPGEHKGHLDVTPVRLAVLRAINKMKDAARDETETDLKVIYNRYYQALLDQKFTVGDIHSKQDGKLLRYPDLRPTLAGQRRSVVPILPKKIEEIDFDLPEYEEYTKTSESKPFLQYDNKKNPNRILIFISGYGIDWLRESHANHSDGTFWSAPKYFFQFYVIFGQKNLMILPCVYSALPNKTTNSYVEMLNALKLIIKPLGSPLDPYLPNTALTDFELAIQNAFVHCFPLIKIKGCFFHFKHAHQSWTSRHSLKTFYRSNYDFRIWVKF